MMIKKSIFGAAVVALIAPTILATSVHADGGSMDTNAGVTTTDPVSQTTHGTIAFTGAPVGPTTPIDPNDPTKPTDPNNPDIPSNPGTGYKDGLRLLSAASFDFGTYDLKNGPSIVKRNPILRAGNGTGVYATQVSDIRTGGKGWTVSVSNSQFKNDKNGATLNGATLNLATPSVTNSAQVVTSQPIAIDNPAYQRSAATLNGDGTSTNVMQVVPGKDAGNLTTSINWKPQDVELSAPVGNVNAGDAFDSTITWTLNSAQ